MVIVTMTFTIIVTKMRKTTVSDNEQGDDENRYQNLILRRGIIIRGIHLIIKEILKLF